MKARFYISNPKMKVSEPVSETDEGELKMTHAYATSWTQVLSELLIGFLFGIGIMAVFSAEIGISEGSVYSVEESQPESTHAPVSLFF